MIPDYWPPSLNKTQRSHWSKLRKIKKRAMDLLHVHAMAAGGVPKFVGPVCVWLYRVVGYRGKLMDQDNLTGSVKPLIDAMRAHKPDSRQGGIGIIEDDDPDKLTLHVEQYHWNDDEIDRRIRAAGLKSFRPVQALEEGHETFVRMWNAALEKHTKQPTSTFIVVRGKRDV